jgi:hypothetical protein
MAATGQLGTLTFKVIDPPSGAVVIAESTSGITEVVSGVYSRTFTTPATVGEYLIVWANGAQLAAEELTVTHSQTLASGPSGTDLCSLAQVREFLQKPASDIGQDAVIAATITRASALIIDECQREFAPITASQARDFAWFGGWVNLAPYDAATVTTVVADPDGTDPVTVTEWTGWPAPSRHGVITDLIVANLTPPTGIEPVIIRVTGTWGFPSIPQAVQHACVLTVATHLRRDVAAFTTTFNLDENRVERPMSLPSAAWSALQPYRRTVSA